MNPPPKTFVLPARFRLEASYVSLGDDVEGIGYLLHDDLGEVFCRERASREAGVHTVRAAGVLHHSDGQRQCFAAGNPVILRKDPTNWSYPSAVKILDGAGRRVLGLVSKSDVGNLPSSFEDMSGIVLTEYVRGLKRVGAIALFLGPPQASS